MALSGLQAEQPDVKASGIERFDSPSSTANSATPSQTRPEAALEIPGRPAQPARVPDLVNPSPGTVLAETHTATHGAGFSVAQHTFTAGELSTRQPAVSPQRPSETAELAAEAAARFVRGASLDAAAGVQRLNVLLEDDRLGRIALRMVERAGLIHAVLRTDDSRGAQLISESLPALLESLSQRGLLASWTSSYNGSPEQQADPRQGQSRRQRYSGGQSGRRDSPRPAQVFQVEAK